MRSTTVIFAAVAALAQFVAATPPACLIHAVGVQANPADTKVLCGSGKDWVIGNITEACGDDTESSVLSIYKSTCSSAGYQVTLPSATATATSASKTASASASKTSSASSTVSGAADEDENVSDIWANSGNATVSEGSSANGTSGTHSPQSTGAGSALSASSSIFLGSMIAVAGLASQLLL